MEENRKSIISDEEITINLNGDYSDAEKNVGKRTARRAAEKKTTRIGKKKNKKSSGKEKKKWSKKKIAIIIASIIAIILVITGIVFGRYVYKAEGDVKQAVISMTKDVATTIVGKDEPIFVLVLGISEDITSKLTDTIILAGYNPKTQKAFMVSIPRDTFVGTNEANASGWDKINALYQKDISKTIKAVEERTGFNIDKYVIVRNTMLPAMVNAIGEVEFDVPIDMDYDDPTQDLHIHLQAGVQMINGDKAEQLLRFRHNNDGSSYPSSWGDNDYGRMRTQREFIKAVAQKLISLDNVTNIKGIAEAVFSNLETNMSIGDLIGYIPYAIDFNVDDIRMEQLPGSGAMLNKLSFYKASHTRSKKLMDELIKYLGLDEKETKKYYTGKIKQTIAATPEAEKQDACEHTYVTEITKEATCKETGIRKYTCSLCNSTYEEEIAKSNHNYNSNGICTLCDTPKPTDDHTHNYSILDYVIIEATCTAPGSAVYKCDTCTKATEKPIKKIAHNYGTDGKCTVCGEKKTTDNTVTDQPTTCTHTNQTTETVAATCGAAGSTIVKCTDCQKVISNTPIPATGTHTPGTPVTTNPTCGTAGSIVTKCTVCSSTISSETIPATGAHNYTNGVCSCGAKDQSYVEQPPVTENPPATDTPSSGAASE